MCITMGIAEAIVIRMIVTANIFAISSRLWHGIRPCCLVEPRLFESPPLLAAAIRRFSSAATALKAPLLRLESEIGAPGRTCGDRHFLSLGTGGLLPCSNCVISGRDVVDGVSAAAIGGCVRPFYHRMPTVHPGMDVALYFDKLRSLPALLDWRSPRRLRLIPRDVAGHRVGIRVNVVRRLIAGCDLECLARIEPQHVRGVHAIF